MNGVESQSNLLQQILSSLLVDALVAHKQIRRRQR